MAQSSNHRTKHTPSRPLLIACGALSIALVGVGMTWLVRGALKPAAPPTSPRPAPYQRIIEPDNDLPSTARLDTPATPPAETEATPDTAPAPEGPVGDITNVTAATEEGVEIVPEDHTIFAAAYHGKLDEVKQALKQQPSLLNARDAQQEATPLLWSLVKGQHKVAEYLISRGADVNLAGKQGWTPLHRAAYSGHDALVTLLLEKGAHINAADRTNGTALMKAIGRGNQRTATLLIERGAATDVRETDEGLTALHIAVINKQQAVVEKLLASGAEVNAKDNIGATPLFYAECNKLHDLAQLLKAAGGTE